MKRFIRSLSLLLIAAMLLSFAMPAFAKCSHKHKIVKWQVEATCTKGGRGVQYCKDCGKVLNSHYTSKPLGHDWEKTPWTPKATCLTPGSRIQMCLRCGKTREQTQAALGHSWSDWVFDSDTNMFIRTCRRCHINDKQKPEEGLLLEYDATIPNEMQNISGNNYLAVRFKVTNTGTHTVLLRGCSFLDTSGGAVSDSSKDALIGFYTDPFADHLLEPNESSWGSVYFPVRTVELLDGSLSGGLKVFGSYKMKGKNGYVISNEAQFSASLTAPLADEQDSLSLTLNSVETGDVICSGATVRVNATLTNTGTRAITYRDFGIDSLAPATSDTDVMISGPAYKSVLSPGQSVPVTFGLMIDTPSLLTGTLTRTICVYGQAGPEKKNVTSNTILASADVNQQTALPEDKTPGTESLLLEAVDMPGNKTVNGAQVFLTTVTVTNTGTEEVTVTGVGAALDPNSGLGDRVSGASIDFAKTKLAPGASVTGTLTFSVTPSDLACHTVIRYVTVSGQGKSGPVCSNRALIGLSTDYIVD